MSKISIKYDFKNGDKLYDVDLNNNFRVIEAGVNANEENLEQVIEDAEERLTNVFEEESAATEARIAADNLATKNAIIADNDATEQAIKDDNDETEANIEANNAATVTQIRNLVVNEGWDWGGTTTERVRFFKGNTSAVNQQPITNGQLLFDKESGIISLDDNNARTLLGGALWEENPKKSVKYKRKTTAEIALLPVEDGSIIYNTDNGKQFMDIGNNRIPTGGAGGEVVLDESDITDDTKLIIEDEDLEFQQDDALNEYSNSTTESYSANYTNNLVKDIYSTEEVKTNKVYKGKPVYRKMFENIPLENSGSATNKTLGVLENFEESVIMYAEIKTPTNIIYTGYASNAVYIEPWIDAKGNAKIIYVFNGTGQKGKAIFEYTKTTD